MSLDVVTERGKQLHKKITIRKKKKKNKQTNKNKQKQKQQQKRQKTENHPKKQYLVIYRD